MIDRNANKQLKPKTVVDPKGSTGNVATITDTPSSQDRTRERAYELYEIRGRVHGQDEQDWLRAEQEILKRNR
jgi:hypothetical protein